MLVGLAAGIAACDNPPGPGDPTSEASPALAESVSLEVTAIEQIDPPYLDEIYDHPLMGVPDVNGLYPLADIQNAPSGRRYAIEETVIFDEAGREVRESGLVEREYRRMTPSEMQALASHKRGTAPAITAEPKLGIPLQEVLANAPDAVPLELTLSVALPETEPAFVTIQKEIARGNIVTHRDVDSMHQRLLQARRSLVAAVQERVAAEITARGGEVLGRCEVLTCMSLRLPASRVREVASLATVKAINLATVGMRDANIVGTQVVQGSQIKQFIDATHDGEYGANTDIPFAIIEFDDYRDEHLAFRDVSGGATARIHSRRSCTISTCSTVLNFPNPPTTPATNAHATIDLGIIFGDLRDGQDAGHGTLTAQVARSGYAGEAWGHLYKADLDIRAVQKALDDVPSRSPLPRVVNLSLSFNTDDPTCMGTTPISQDVNDLYELGHLVFKSAGNTGHSGVND